MAEFQSIFTGQEVDNTINKLRSWIAVDGTYPTVTISGVTYAVIWKSIPVSGKACYGIGLHPTTGRVYEIYYNGSSYTATALDADTKNTAGAIDNNTDKLYLVGAKNQGESPQTYSNSKVYTQNGKLYSNNTEVSVDGHTHDDRYYTETEINTKLANYVPKSVLTTKGDIIYASAANTPTRLGIGSNGQFLSIANGIPAWVNNPNTDTKVTSVDNHYSPTANSGAELTAALSGTAGAYAKDTEYTVLTGVKAQRDAKGHVTGITYTAQKIKDTNTDTNTSHSHSAGVGLVGSGSAGTGGGTYDYKAKLRSETALTVDSAAATTTSGRVYPVAVDKSGYLSVNVPWTDTNTDTDTHYTNYLQIKGNGTEAIKFTQNADKTLNLKPGNNVAISVTSGEITIGATVPTKLSELENDEGYVDTTTFNSHTGNTSNPHNVTKAQVGLGNVDNTSDLNKPISTLQQKCLDKSLYNLGAFDTISGDAITRKTGYINKNNITSYGINGDYPSSTAHITGDFLTRINNVDNIKSNKHIYLNNLTTDNISLNKIDGAFNSQEALDQFISELEIQYETKTSYTDGKIEEQPLITLDSLGSQWLRDEWEKGINLYSGEKTFSGNDTRRFFAPKLQLYNNGTFLQEFHSTDVRDINTLVSFTFTKPSNCNVLKFGHNGSQIDVTTSYDISNLSNKTYTLSFLVTSYTGPQSFTNIMLNEGTHALPYQEYNGSIIRENQFNDLLGWIERNIVIEKTQSVRGNANGYQGGEYYYYQGSFTVDGIVKTAVFSQTGSNVAKTDVGKSGNTITYKLFSKTGSAYVAGTIKYTYGK